MAAEQDLNRLIDRLDKLIDLQQGVAGEFDAMTTKVDRFGEKGEQSANRARSAFKKFYEDLAITSKFVKDSITVIPNTLEQSFGRSFKTIGQFENQIFIASKRLEAMNRGYSDVARTQKIYRDQIEAITRATFLSRQESKALFDQLNYGFKGIKTDSTIRQITNITTNLGRLGLTAEEVQRKIQQVGNAVDFAEMRRALEGGASRGDMRKLAMARRLGLISRDALFTAQESQNAALNRNMTDPRQTAVRDAARTQSGENRRFAEMEAVTQEKIAQAYVDLGTVTNRLGENIAELTSKLDMLSTISGDFSKIASTIGGAGSYAKGMFGGFGGGPAGRQSLAGSAMALAGGKLGGSAALLTGNATPVFVVNMPGGGISTIAGRAGATAAGGVTAAAGGAAAAAGAGITAAQMAAGRRSISLLGNDLSRMAYGTRAIVNPWAMGANAPTMGARVGEIGSRLRVGARAGSIGGAGASMGARSVPIVGALLAGGIEASRDDYQGAGNKLGAGATTTVGTLGGAAMGAAIGTAIAPVIGTAIGGIAGGLLGSFGGSRAARAIFGKDNEKGVSYDNDRLDKIREEAEIARSIMALQKDINGTLRTGTDHVGELTSKLEEAEVQFGLMAMAADKVASSISGAVSTMGQFPGLADQTAGAMQYQASIMNHQLLLMAKQENILAKNLQLAIQRGDEEEIYIAQMDLAEMQSQRINKYYQQQQILIESIKKPFEDRIKLQQINVDLASAELERNKALRLGIGINYRDQVRLVATLADKVKLEKQAADALMQQAKMAQDPAVRKQLEMEAAQAQQRALQSETKMLEEAKSMREGYLDSLEETVAGLGAYAKILPKQGFGNQFFADTPSLGRVADSDASAAQASQEPVRFGMQGPMITDSIVEGFERGIEAYSKYNESYLWNLQQTIEQAYGPGGASGGAILGSQQIQMANMSSYGMPNAPGAMPGAGQTYGQGGMFGGGTNVNVGMAQGAMTVGMRGGGYYGIRNAMIGGANGIAVPNPGQAYGMPMTAGVGGMVSGISGLTPSYTYPQQRTFGSEYERKNYNSYVQNSRAAAYESSVVNDRRQRQERAAMRAGGFLDEKNNLRDQLRSMETRMSELVGIRDQRISLEETTGQNHGSSSTQKLIDNLEKSMTRVSERIEKAGEGFSSSIQTAQIHKQAADEAQERQRSYSYQAQQSGLAAGIQGIGTPEQQEIAARERERISRREGVQNRESIISNERRKFEAILGGQLEKDEQGNYLLTQEQLAGLQAAGQRLTIVDPNEGTALGAYDQARQDWGGGVLGWAAGTTAFYQHKLGMRDSTRKIAVSSDWENFDQQGSGEMNARSWLAGLGDSGETADRFVQGRLERRENAISARKQATRISLAGEDQILSQQEISALTPEMINQAAINQGFGGAQMMGYDQNLGVFIIRVETGFGETSDFQIPVAKNVSPS